MRYEKLQKFRKLLLYLWMVVLPITFNWMSPVLIIFAGMEALINLSFIIFALWFISSLFIGRAYCAYACQWGAIQEVLANQVPKKLDNEKKKKRRKIKYILFPIWVIFIFIGPIIAGGYSGVNIFYPNSLDEHSLISFDGTQAMALIFYFGIQLSVAVFFTLVAGNRSFCNYGCPMAIIGIIGTKIKNKLKYPSLHLESDKSKCINCKRCSKECPMGIDVNTLVQLENMEHNECIMCGSCIGACRQDVIEYTWKWNKK